jgi:hypothetical protein
VSQTEQRPQGAAPDDPSDSSRDRLRDVTLWVGQLARAIKNCRLYDRQPAVVTRLGTELTGWLSPQLDRSGALTLQFTGQDILLDRYSLLAEPSTKEDLAQAFHRDGVRSLTFKPGIEPEEIGALLDILSRTGPQSLPEHDLVTMLWEADLVHIDVDAVPAEGEFMEGAAERPATEGSFLPWPAARAEEGDGQPGGTWFPTGRTTGDSRTGRSDDWVIPDSAGRKEGQLELVDAEIPPEVEGFRQEYEREQETSLIRNTLSITEACLSASEDWHDAAEFAQLIPRVVRLASSSGAWPEAREGIRLLKRCCDQGRLPEGLTRQFRQITPTQDIVKCLDQQSPDQIEAFILFARELRDQAIQWLVTAMAESEVRRNRRLLVTAVVDACRQTPVLLDPWVSDQRWYVVRNIVYVLGQIGGKEAVELLSKAARHREERVRRQVVMALRGVALPEARATLMSMLTDSDSGIFCAVLEAFSGGRDPEAAGHLKRTVASADFPRRSSQERSAIYAALGSTGGDDALPILESQLLKGNLLSRGQVPDCDALVSCIARIGSPRAQALLDRGTRSWNGSVKKACLDALARIPKDG